ncbi:MAG: bifunctional 3,4-dihydroxy-2-butanone-4-phosphate synthase/GTP cyclohydrolase II [Acidobacteria bacterium]|nr:bifunctional 3,4-dihydroxy-2-butanone-4-phosphate synthase/GTP cyclohydrolase II [Acidobacteriota bacterium]
MFNTIEDALVDFRKGKLIIICDDEDRENEGDLAVAAEKVNPEVINFMAKHGRGLICMPMMPERLDALKIPMMVSENTSTYQTAFCVSIEGRSQVTTGISAADRAQTVLTAIDQRTRPEDLIRPGHMFPLRARTGGVLERAGQTEAVIDMCRIAGMLPAGVICEVMNDDGTMARVPHLREFADRHQLKMITVADLIKYRMRTEMIVKQVAEAQLPTKAGEFKVKVFENIINHESHVVLVMGDVAGGDPVLVRAHSQCLTGDVFLSRRCDCGDQLRKAMDVIGAEGRGVILYMSQEGRGIGLANKIKAYHLQDKGVDTVEANEHLGFKPDQRDYGVGAQILRSIGVARLRLLTNNPRKFVAMEGYGLKIVERVPIEIPPSDATRKYLKTKKEKLGHLLSKV